MSKTIRINYDSTEYSHLDKFRADGKFPDVVLKIGDRSFPCHRLILASTMKYFESMFTGNLAEASNEEVLLKWPNADDFELLLTYAYGGSVSVGLDNIYRLWKISHYFGLQKLEESCIDYIVQDETSLSPDSAINIFIYASRIGKKVVVEKLIGWMAENFGRLVRNKKFFYCSANDLIKIFTSRSFKKNSTMQLNFLANWVEYHPEEERKKYLSQLMDTIDLKTIPTDWYVQVVMGNAVLRNVSKNNKEDEPPPAGTAAQVSVLNMDLDEIDLFTESKENIALPFTLLTLEAKNRKDIEKIQIKEYRLETEDDLECVYRFHISDMENNYVESKGDVTEDFSSFDCSSVRVDHARFIIFSSLFENNAYKANRRNSLRIYVKNNLSEMKLIYRRFGNRFDLTSLGDDRDATYITTTAYNTSIVAYNNLNFNVYNCNRNDCLPMNTTNFHFTHYPSLSSRDNNSIYVIGGKYKYSAYSKNEGYYDFATGENEGKLLQHYDVRQKKWMQLPQMKYARSQATSCVYNDKIYVSGGDHLAYFGKCNVEYFDIKAYKWNEFETAMPKSKMKHSLVAFNNRLWFFGGVEPGLEASNDSTWFSYDLGACKWSDIFSLSMPASNRILDAVVEL